MKQKKLIIYIAPSSSHICDINHNWPATKQRLHPQSVAEISRHSVLSGDRIRQCGTSSGSRHKDTGHVHASRSKSGDMTLQYGVPQGSVLGPRIFTEYAECKGVTMPTNIFIV